ncbi:MAG: amidase [Deltaproteobacteria bacterium]|nr:amidase [Deltaproteobacteria bacterium]
MDPIVFLSASALAEKIRTQALTSVQVVKAFINQISAQNERYNAVVLLNAEAALRRAAEADAAIAKGESWGPLHGVPITVKDTLSVAGLRTTAGHVPLADYVPEKDATVIALLRDAGAIILAKTNAPTLAMDMQTDNPLFGKTNNPWDVAKTPGGSSGGCATALATGMTPLSVGSDLAGSIRIPSSYVGVYGFKPTFGVTSMRGHVPPQPTEINGIRNLAVTGPLARSIEDLELAIKIMAQPHASDYSPRPLRNAPPAGALTSVRALRVAYATTLGGVAVDAEIAAAIERFAQRLRDAGAIVQKAEPLAMDYDNAWETWGALVGMQGGYEHSNLARSFSKFFVSGRTKGIPMQRRILDPISVPKYMEALEAQSRQIDAIESFLTSFDVWIVPTSATVAFNHHRPTTQYGTFNVYDEPLVIGGAKVPYYVATQSYTTLFNLTENPVVAMPIDQTQAGLPIGVQVVGARYDDLRLLKRAKLLDQFGLHRPFPLEQR